MTGIAAYELLSPLAGTRQLHLKWPNDLLLDGGKCAGMLLEREEQHVVVGIGINLASAPDIAERSTAAFADGMHHPAFDPAALMPDLAKSFAEELARWRGEGLAPILARWQAQAHPRGTALSVSLGPDERIAGRFAGLAADGALMLEQNGGAHREVRAADVEIVREWN